MAHFVLVADHPKWPLYLVVSYLDQDRPYARFDLRRTPPQKRKWNCKNMFMLSWSINERRIMESSEWRDLLSYSDSLAEWAKLEIERYMED